MAIYWKKSVREFKDFVLQNNIRTGKPSGTYDRLLKYDYLAAIKNYLDSLPLKSIIPCEWLWWVQLKSAVDLLAGCKIFPMHRGRIRDGQSISAPCRVCDTKTKSHLCTRCGGTRMNEHLKCVEERARGNYALMMEGGIYTEQQKKRRMNTIYQHGRLHTGCVENHSSRIPSPYMIFKHSHDSE